MSTFQAQIEDYIGTFSDTTALTNWLTDGYKYLVTILSKRDLEKYSTRMTAINTSTDYTNYRVLSVTSGTIPAEYVNRSDFDRAFDSNSLFYADSYSPKYTFLYGIIHMIPASNDPLYVDCIQFSTIAYSDSPDSITGLPPILLSALVLYAASHVAMSKSTASLNVSSTINTFNVPSVPLTTVVAPTWNDASLSDVYSSTQLATFGTPPTYLKPTVSLSAFSSYTSGLSETDPGVLSIASTPPVAPSLSSVSVSFSETAPSYTKPVVSLDFSQVDTYIDTEEDIELASGKINEINTKINKYLGDIKNELNEFNKEVEAYRTQLQIAIENARLTDSKSVHDLQKYNNEVNEYQINVTKEVQEYSQKLAHYNLELTTAYQAWAKTESDKVQVYSSDIQNELNEFNKEMTIYQASIQESIENARLTQEYLLNKASTETDLNMKNKMQATANEVNKYQLELQKYNGDISNYNQQVNAEAAKLSTLLQKSIGESQGYLALSEKLKTEFLDRISLYNKQENIK